MTIAENCDLLPTLEVRILVNPGTNHPFEIVVVGENHVSHVNRNSIVLHASYRKQCKSFEQVTVSVNGVNVKDVSP